MTAFKVIIVGGSIAGLTLANILERYGIDYVVLEKHGNIAPQLGASLGLLPHGERILDQLGMFSQVEAISMPVNDSYIFGPDGLSLGAPESFGNLLEEPLGYRMRFLDRRQLLQILFDNICDKSKVRTSCEVFKIEELDGAVQVVLKGGSTVCGNIVVGADGVHSRIREEIWRIAGDEMPSYPAAQMSQDIKCTYKCMFGISKRPAGIPENVAFKAFHKNRSYLCSSGLENKMYFFGFFKNSEITTHRAIPRYTADDAKAIAAEYGDDAVADNLTFGDLYERQMSCVVVPLEEFVLDKCFYKRAVLIGDSFHKMNPLSGQGGNSAIESAGLLADLLKTALDKNNDLDNSMIQEIFEEFQTERRPRTKMLMEGTQKMQRMEALETPLLEFLQLKVTTKIGGEHFSPVVTGQSTPGRTLKYLPQTQRSGLVLLDQDVKANPHDRSGPTTVFWMAIMLSLTSLSTIFPRYLVAKIDRAEPGAVCDYMSLVTVAINGLWVLESHRSGSLISPLFSAIPYILASTAFGWEIILPVYFALSIYMSKTRSFYYPSPRAINLSVAKVLPKTLIIAYAPLIIQFATKFGQQQEHEAYITPWALSLTHLSLPVLLHIGKRFYKSASDRLSIGQLLYEARDMKYLSSFFTLILIFMSTSHLILVCKYLGSLNFELSTLTGTPSIEWVQLGCLALTIVTWCLFVVWDMRRVNLTKASMPVALLGLIIGSVFLGPGAVLAGLWRWREQALENGRQRKTSN